MYKSQTLVTTVHFVQVPDTRAVRKVSKHVEYPENRSRGLDVT